MNSKSLLYVLVILIIGMLLGTMLSLLVSEIIPKDTNVYKFLTNTKAVGWGAGNNSWIQLGFMRFRTGFYMEISVLSLIGFFVSWYFLRYFK